MQGVARTTAKFDQSAEEKVFKEVWKVIAEAMPNGVAFQGKTEDDRSFGPFSPALFEMISVGIAKNLDAAKRVGPTELKKKITELIKEAKQQGLTGSGSNSRKKFNKRLELGEKRFS
jgi:hypothetical protein